MLSYNAPERLIPVTLGEVFPPIPLSSWFPTRSSSRLGRASACRPGKNRHTVSGHTVPTHVSHRFAFSRYYSRIIPISKNKPDEEINYTMGRRNVWLYAIVCIRPHIRYTPSHVRCTRWACTLHKPACYPHCLHGMCENGQVP